MARSTYVYIVMLDGKPVAGFTVKREMKQWLNRAEPADYDFWRCEDGVHQTNAPVLLESLD